jgi:hypothetical protein
MLSYGPTSLIRVPTARGGVLEITPPNGSHFVRGQDIGVDVQDYGALRLLRTDPRFQEI